MMYNSKGHFKTGMVMMFSETASHIPTGWALCTGANGTPDLRDKFVIGAGGTYAGADEGGAATHDHGGIPSDHGHNIVSGNAIQAGSDYEAGTSETFGGGTTDAGSTIPPFFALAYIMKL